MSQTMFLLWIPVAHHLMDDTQANIAARYDWGYLSNNDPLNPDGSVNYGPYITLSDRLRTLNPNHKTGWFAGGIGAQRPIDPLWPWLRDDFILHLPDGQPIVPELPGKFINWMSRTVCYDLADNIAAFLESKGWHGIAFDSYAPNEWASWIQNLAGSPGCREGPANTTVWWEEALMQGSEILRTVLSRYGFEVIVNGIAPGEQHGSLGMARVNAADYASGMLYEMGHRFKTNPAYTTSMLSAISQVTAKRRMVHDFVQPRVASATGDPPPNEADPQAIIDDHRLHFARYLLTWESPYTLFGLHPYKPYSAWDQDIEPIQIKMHWSDDWHAARELGPPLGTYFWVGETDPNGADLWVRHYARGLVLVNPTNGNQTYGWAGIGRLWERNNPVARVIDTRAGGQLIVSPFSGWLIWTG